MARKSIGTAALWIGFIVFVAWTLRRPSTDRVEAESLTPIQNKGSTK